MNSIRLPPSTARLSYRLALSLKNFFLLGLKIRVWQVEKPLSVLDKPTARQYYSAAGITLIRLARKKTQSRVDKFKYRWYLSLFDTLATLLHTVHNNPVPTDYRVLAAVFDLTI